MKNKWVYILLLAIISLIIFLSISYIGGRSLIIKLVTGSAVYFVTTYLILVNSSSFTNKIIPFFIISFPPILAFLIFNILQFKDTSVSFPSSMFLIIGTVSAFLFYKTKKIIIPLILSLLVILWVVYLQDLYNNIRIYKTYNQKVSFNYPLINIYDTTGNAKLFNDNHKYYFLDFWTSHCAPCFRLFPYVDSISKAADTSRFEFIAVNIPLNEEKKEDNYRILDSFDYSFKKLYADGLPVADSFRVEYFPTTIVIKNNQVIFRGDFKTAIKRFEVLQ